uniref:Uncharacterized protein n=1 Tax=Rhizophora mucronata TaxID=61149 RepID=A0A2P2Q782_RHIMU
MISYSYRRVRSCTRAHGNMLLNFLRAVGSGALRERVLLTSYKRLLQGKTKSNIGRKKANHTDTYQCLNLHKGSSDSMWGCG